MITLTKLPFSIRSFDCANGPIEIKTTNHNYYEVILFVAGYGTNTYDGIEHPIESRSIHFIPIGTTCNYNLHLNSIGYVLSFSRNFYIKDAEGNNFLDALKFFQPGERYSIKPEISDFIQIQDIVRKLSKELDGEDVHLEIIKSYMKILLLRCSENTMDRFTMQQQGIPSPITEKFKELIDTHFLSLHKVSDYTDMLGISDKQLLKVVKSSINVTPGNLIAERRISEAKKMFLYTDMSNQEIAYYLNFDDPAHFSKFFKNKAGVTPNHYREEIGKIYTN